MESMDFPQELYAHFQEIWPSSTLVRATRGNTPHDPDISEGLSLFHNNRWSWSAVRLWSAQLLKSPEWPAGLETKGGRIKWEVFMSQTWKWFHNFHSHSSVTWVLWSEQIARDAGKNSLASAQEEEKWMWGPASTICHKQLAWEMTYWTILFSFNLGSGRIYLETLAQKLLLTVLHKNLGQGHQQGGDCRGGGWSWKRAEWWKK